MPKSLWTLPLPIMKARKASRFLKADAVVFFFFCARKSPCTGLQWNERRLRSRERHGPERKRAVDFRWPTDETTLSKPGGTRGCSASEVKFTGEGSAADRAANTRCRPTRSVHSDFRLQQHIQVAKKVKQYLSGLSGCVPVDEKYGA